MLKVFRPLALILIVAFSGACDSLTGADTFKGCEITTYQIGSTVAGTLTDDCSLEANLGRYIDYYAFTRSSSNTFTIEMTSDQFDSRIFVFTRDGAMIHSARASGAGTNARLAASLPAGNYVIGAAASRNGDTGSYTLSSN